MDNRGVSYYSDLNKSINLEKKHFTFPAFNTSTFVHEISHAFHYMISPMGFASFLNMSVYAAINSENLNFRTLFFPMLSEELMEPIVAEMEKAISAGIQVEKLRNDMGEIIKKKDNAVDKKDITIGEKDNTSQPDQAQWLYDTLQLLINSGFAGVVFNKSELANNELEAFDLSKILTAKHIARAIYVLASVFGKYEGCYWVEDKSMDNPILKDKERFSILWQSSEEMLTMFGGIPLIIDGKPVVLQDRQNEFMYLWRSLDKLRFVKFIIGLFMPSSAPDSRTPMLYVHHWHKTNASIINFIANSFNLLGMEKTKGLRSTLKELEKKHIPQTLYPSVSMFEKTSYWDEEFVTELPFSGGSVFYLIRNRNLSTLKKVISKSDLLKCGICGHNALTYAIFEKKYMNADEVQLALMDEVIKFIIDNSSENLLNSEDCVGISPLEYAVYSNDKDTLDKLLNAGVDLSKCNESGRNALTSLLDRYYLPDKKTYAVKAIIDYVKEHNNGAFLSQEDNKGDTPLKLAVRGGDIQILHELLNAGADLSKCDKSGRNALTYWLDK
jgi:ankyrin repeat protein